jgi:hypothetical protein
MSHKMSPHRRAAFLKAVRETGNQSLAAERAKVSRSWVQLHRSADPAFDADVRAAIETAKTALRSAEGQRPPSGWGFFDGEELVVRGTNGRRVQIARARLRQWTPRAEGRFLQVLSATCNVEASCAAVGLSPVSAYEHRKRWPAFGERWDDAIEAGSRRIDGGLTASAIASLEPPEPGEPPIEPIVAPMSVDDAIRLVRLHERRAREAEARRLGRARGCGPKWPGVAGKRRGEAAGEGVGTVR